MAIRRNHIRRLAEELLSRYAIERPPVDVEAIAKGIGLQYDYQPLESDLSGFTYREKDRAFVGINSNHPLVRQRFTLAHELGHYLLHQGQDLHVDRGFQVKLRGTLSSQGVDEDEMEANLFAAELLMPRSLLQRDLGFGHAVDLADEDFDLRLRRMADLYKVSTQALAFRLSNLGYSL